MTEQETAIAAAQRMLASVGNIEDLTIRPSGRESLVVSRAHREGEPRIRPFTVNIQWFLTGTGEDPMQVVHSIMRQMYPERRGRR